MVEKRPGELEAIQWRVVIIWSLLIRRPESVLGLKDWNTPDGWRSADDLPHVDEQSAVLNIQIALYKD